ncbi:MAG TPA: DUF2071 domain-containing protein [Bryobacteraceae bacterium]|nr:DUF2071 domain-containing protein [Bryobacteraceae bacterium]
MFQSWCRLTFLHWRYDVEAVRRLVPPQLEIEAFDGSAWVGITPFVVRDLHPVLLPPLPWISTFPETNCRTYVRGPDGAAGVWFFSLDAARLAAVTAARLGYGLPYKWSKMQVVESGSEVSYHSRRIWPDSLGKTSIRVAQAGAAKQTALEIFLTARFRLYSFIGKALTYTNVEHAPWPLEWASVIKLEQTLTEAAGLPHPAGAALAHFSPGVAVRIARPRAVSSR